MKGYKVFNPDWTCRGFQYEVGQTYEEDVTPKNCIRGFHFCEMAVDCFNYYSFDPNNKVAEVLALGEVDTDGIKSCTNKIQIVREILWEELLTIVNTGKGCSGHSNSGHSNSGHSNSGHSNSGHSNSGNRNSGDWNSGDWNSGHSNSGHSNSGDWNSGNRNSGDWNSGNRNSGDWNSGDWNSGDWNSGNRNSGDWNSGDWNKSSNNTGCFNTEKHQLMFFDKPTDMTFDQWRSSDAYWLLTKIDFRPTEWIDSYYMTDEEKAAHPEHETTGGYLKKRNNEDCCIDWWNSLGNSQKNIIKNIPNFNADKFFEITGIRVDE